MSGRIYKPLHCGISVSDLEKGIRWFEEILGFQLLSKSEMTPMGFRAAFLSNGDGFEIELFEYKAPKPLPEGRLLPDDDLQTLGTKHIAFAVDNLDEVIAELKAKKVQVVMEPFMAFGMYCSFIYGPDNVLIEMIQR